MLELGVCAISAAIDGFDTIGRAMVFVAAARACGPFGAHPSRPISINALAASLNRPFETTRRNANALIDQGLMARFDSGLCVMNQSLTMAMAGQFVDQCHDLLVRLVEDVRASDIPLSSARRDVTYDPRLGTGIAFELLLAGFECHQLLDRNQMRCALLTTVEWATARFGDDDALVPVKPSTVARVLGLPYATVARNLDILLTNGTLARRDGGLIVAPDHLGSDIAKQARRTLSNRARQLVGRLAQTGFPMQRPAIAYIQRRPPLPALG